MNSYKLYMKTQMNLPKGLKKAHVLQNLSYCFLL